MSPDWYVLAFWAFSMGLVALALVGLLERWAGWRTRRGRDGRTRARRQGQGRRGWRAGWQWRWDEPTWEEVWNG